MIKTIITHSEEETKALGHTLWRKYKKFLGKEAIIFALEGELGTGKTQLVKGLAKSMDIKDDVISPTFTIEAEYDLGKLIHIDAWRMENPEEFLRIGIKKNVENKKVIVIEWANQVKKILNFQKTRMVWIRLKYGKKKNERIISINFE